MDAETKDYEIAYLLSLSTPENEVATHAGKITSLIGDLGGVVKFVEEPKMRRLAYIVKKEQSVYFGYTTFTMAKSSIGDLKKKLAFEPKILRFLIVEEEEKSIPMPRAIFREPTKRAVVTPRETEEKEKLDIVQLDKKLEEILGPKL